MLAEVGKLVNRIVIYPRGDIELVGEFAALLGPEAGDMRALVAEEGLEPPTRGL